MNLQAEFSGDCWRCEDDEVQLLPDPMMEESVATMPFNLDMILICVDCASERLVINHIRKVKKSA